MPASAAIGEFSQGAHNDFQNWPCGIAQSLVYARTGCAAPQPDTASLWRQDEGERSGAEGGRRCSDAQTRALDLWGGEIRKTV